MSSRTLGALSICLLAACSGDAPAGQCTSDDDCGRTELCQAATCVARAELECSGDKAPLIIADPRALDFGRVGERPVRRTVSLGNEGDCLLQITTLELEAGASSRFRCPGCDASMLPQTLYPGRELELELEALPGEPGTVEDTLVVQTSDPSTRYFRVQLSMVSTGLPEMQLVPGAIDFGFVDAGRTSEQIVAVINTSRGTTPLDVASASIEGADAALFSVVPGTALPTSVPASSADPSARLELTVSFAPQDVRAHEAELAVAAATGETIRISMTSLAEPPEIQVSQSSLDFGTVVIGQTQVRSVTIQNTGRAPLSMDLLFQTGRGDLTIPATAPPEIAPGSFVEVNIVYEPTLVGPLNDALLIVTNDPDDATVAIPITANGEAPPVGASEVVAIQLDFDNESNSLLDQDLRDVDLILENTAGQVCNEQTQVANWGAAGRARWSAGGARENPERILLSDAMQDGMYTVTVVYNEDCASLPTALVAALLGIGVDELAQYFSDGDIDLDEMEVSSAVEQTCVQRKSAGAVVTITINGAPSGQLAVPLNAKGAFASPITLVRANGRFSVVTN